MEAESREGPPPRPVSADLSWAYGHTDRAVSAVPGLTARVAGGDGDVVLDEHPALLAGNVGGAGTVDSVSLPTTTYDASIRV